MRPASNRARASCGLKRLFLMPIPCLAVVGLMHLCGQLRMVYYHTTILGSTYHWSHATIYQVFETRFCPVFGGLLLIPAFRSLWRPGLAGVPAGKAFFAAAWVLWTFRRRLLVQG